MFKVMSQCVKLVCFVQLLPVYIGMQLKQWLVCMDNFLAKPTHTFTRFDCSIWCN